MELATHNRLLLSTLESPVPSLFIMLKVFYFSSLFTTYSHIVVAPAAGWPHCWQAPG
jgi:heme/copper-type cytochrome/quinol oxidase subunit 3